MFIPDYIPAPPAITQLRHQSINTWQHWQPRLQAVGFTAIGLMVIAIAATIEAGRQTRDGWEWIAPRLLAAYRAFCDYQDEPSPAPVPIRFEDEESVILPSLEEFAATLLDLEQEEEPVLQEAPAAQATAKRRGRAKKVKP